MFVRLDQGTRPVINSCDSTPIAHLTKQCVVRRAAVCDVTVPVRWWRLCHDTRTQPGGLPLRAALSLSSLPYPLHAPRRKTCFPWRHCLTSLCGGPLCCSREVQVPCKSKIRSGSSRSPGGRVRKSDNHACHTGILSSIPCLPCTTMGMLGVMYRGGGGRRYLLFDLSTEAEVDQLHVTARGQHYVLHLGRGG